MATDLPYDIIRERIDGLWTSASGMPGDRVRWENENFQKPESPNHWISVHFVGSTYGQQTIGAETQEANRWDEEGTAAVFVMAPQGLGAREARRLARVMANLFRGQRLGAGDELELFDATIGEGETINNEDGNWWRLRVAIDWRLWGA